MNYLLKCLFLSCLLISVVACTDGINETVISAYQLPILPGTFCINSLGTRGVL